MSDLRKRSVVLLERWAEAAEAYWLDLGNGAGCYGPGYQHWGVQSNLNYIAAMATLADQEGVARGDFWRGRALTALRHVLATHVTGERLGNDGRKWGNNWISMLGLERSMHGVARLDSAMQPADRAALRGMLRSEADWLLNPSRGAAAGVNAGLWGREGKNNPESNIWSGAYLWRMAALFPDAPQIEEWREQAHRFLINGVSVEADATDASMVAGFPVKMRHVGANFFPNYALDHHDYMNVGYMAISVSNVAILHFDMKQMGYAVPETLYHHQADLWRVLRGFIFNDGRLLRVGGDSRVRYAYCQEYLLPALLFAADKLGDQHALELAANQLGLMECEAAGGDGLFYGQRVEWLRENNPHYYSRLESDRACVLAMLLNYEPLVEVPKATGESFEESVRGGWLEQEHGAVMERSQERIASFSWRARGFPQGLCIPADRSDLAEWFQNLVPVVRFIGEKDEDAGCHRSLLGYTLDTFSGGFVTCGSVMVGVNIQLDEGAFCTDQAVSHIAFAALPDGHTVLSLQYVMATSERVCFIKEVHGLNLIVPNDIFNGYSRKMDGAAGTVMFNSPPASDEVIETGSNWLSIDESLGVVSFSGGPLEVERSAQRRAGVYKSLYTEVICQGHQKKVRLCQPGELLIDTAFAVLAGADAATTAAVSGGVLNFSAGGVRGVWVEGHDKRRYALVANFSAEGVGVEVLGDKFTLAAGQARVVSGELSVEN